MKGIGANPPNPIGSSDYVDYLEEAVKAVQFRIAIVSAPLVIVVANATKYSELARPFWVICSTTSAMMALFSIAYLSYLIHAAKEYIAYLKFPNREFSDDARVKTDILRAYAFDRKIDEVKYWIVSIIYLLAAISLIGLMWGERTI